MSDYDLYMFDVDGTLIEGYLAPDGTKHPYERVVVLPRRKAVIAKLAEEGASFALATNQGGVAMGYQTQREVEEKMIGVIEQTGLGLCERPLTLHMCLHHPAAKLPEWKEDPCPRRKPGPGMLREAMEAHDAAPDRTIFIGDHKTDEEAAQGAGIDFDYAEHFFNHGVRLHN